MYPNKDNLIKYAKFKSICGQPLLFSNLMRVDMINFLEPEKLSFELNSPKDIETLFFEGMH